MINVNSYTIQDNQKLSGYSVKETVHQEKKHLIVPVTMIVEGVLSGSAGPLLHLASDFGKFPEAWNGIPVVINHPEVNGQNVSANSPEMIDTATVGRVYNSKVVNNELKAEVWLEESKLGSVSPDTLSAIGLKQTIEVSVGVYTEYDETPGTYNGRQYTAIARNHRPDHLALLPGGVGACSIADGCGIRVNSKNNKKGENDGMQNKTAEKIVQFNELKYSVVGIVDNSSKGLKEKLEDLRNLVSSKNVEAQNGVNGIYCYLEEAYETHLIYSMYENGMEKYYKQNYQINVDDEKAAFVGDPIEVEKKIEYEPVEKEVQTNILIRTKPPKKESMDTQKCTPCVKAKVDSLIANKALKFTEEDRAVLETLSETVLERMIPEIPAPVTVNLSAEDQAALDFGKAQLKERRDTKIANITANTAAGIWTPEILANMDEAMLERIEKSIQPKSDVADYSLNAGGASLQANGFGKEKPMLPIV